MPDSDGKRVFFSRYSPRAVYCADIEKGTVKEVFGPKSKTRAAIDWDPDSTNDPLALSPDGKYLVIGAPNTAIVWDLEKKQDRFVCQVSKNAPCKSAAVSADGRQMVTAADTVELWDFHTGAHVTQLWADRHFWSSEPSEVAFSADGAFLVVGGGHAADFEVWRTSDYSHPIIPEPTPTR